MPRYQPMRGNLTSIAHSLPEPRHFGVYAAVQGNPRRCYAFAAPNAPNGNSRQDGLAASRRTQLRSRAQRVYVRNVRSALDGAGASSDRADAPAGREIAVTTAQLQQTEAQFEAAVVEYAERLGWLVYHTHDSRRSNPGYPDLTLVRGSRLVFAELKTEKGRVGEAQDHWLSALMDVEQACLGQVAVHLWRPSQWNEIEAVLR